MKDADALLHRHVEPDRRLVEEQHLRQVQQRADHFHLHPLAQRQIPHGLTHEILDVEQVDQLVARLEEILAAQAVDRAVELERVERREIPLQLVAIPHHERDLAQVVLLAPGRDVSEHPPLARRGVEEAGEHLQRRRLAGAVRAEEADDLARADLERDPVDGGDVARLPPEEALHGRAQPRLALGHVEDLRKLRDADDRRVGHGGQPIRE